MTDGELALSTSPIRERIDDGLQSLRFGNLVVEDAFRLALALVCLPKSEWPSEASELFGMIPDDHAGAGLGVQVWSEFDELLGVEAIDSIVAMFDLVRALDRAWPIQEDAARRLPRVERVH